MDWPPGRHGSTFGGNPVACAAAVATLDLVEEWTGGQRARRSAPTSSPDFVRCSRSIRRSPTCAAAGSMIGIDTPDHDTAEALQYACFERGLLVLTCGERAIRMAPPLVVTIEQADAALAIFADACESVS